MANSLTIYIDGIGSILLEHNTRAKRTIITVKPNKGVRVAVPNRISFDAALEFVNRNDRWIKNTLAKIRQQDSSRKELTEMFSSIDKIKAKTILINKFHVLAKRHGFAYSKVSIRNQKTRWGSCSPKNAISLNMRLVALPEELMDYVILHELVHTMIHNHSRRFWIELDKYVGNGKSKALASRLKKYGGSLS